jgi:predicted acyltransferase (DUF342 family)
VGKGHIREEMHISPSAPTRNQVNVHGTGSVDGMIRTNTSRGNANSTVLSFVISNDIHFVNSVKIDEFLTAIEDQEMQHQSSHL